MALRTMPLNMALSSVIQKGREDITKITYEPWHLRYVGKESAEYITSNDLTMEEYLDQLKKSRNKRWQNKGKNKGVKIIAGLL